ncbi:MAG: DUF4339 domain-containing protein [Planctomycetes bacterium]|nr:DUF4339 domain-containing protein [Planctomycetota bacterium]
MAQWYCYIGGNKYGPVNFEEVQRWAAEGRVKPTDNVWTEGMANWAPASAVPGLCGNVPPAAPGYFPPGGVYLKPNRGTTILVFGILSWIVCIIFGIVAWVMGNNDIREMDAGIMDRSGESNTRAGRMLGKIHVIVSIVVLVLYAIGFAIWAASGGFRHL